MSMAAVAQTAADAPLNVEKSAIFGYFSYETVLQSMPDLAAVREKMNRLRSQYDAEMKRAEDEFNRKYEDFLEGQRGFEPSIYKKRQAELTDLMQRNLAFKEKARKLLAKAEDEAMKPLKERLSAAVESVGRQHGYAFILNADNNALPYVDAFVGQNVTAAIIAELEKKKP